MITHYDLFAGIGGFSLALEEVFQDDSIRHIFCEWESFPTSVLRQHWPDGEFYGDIADLVAVTNAESQRQSRQGQLDRPVNTETVKDRKTSRTNNTHNFSIVTGGFPCQPFSAAGRRKGTADDRYQWPNMFAVIKNTRPDWVIAENVRGLVTWNDGVVLETVCADLESEGYETRPFIIPAVAVGAPHRRDRVWIIASRNTVNGRSQKSDSSTSGKESGNRVFKETDRTDADPGRERRQSGSSQSIRPESQQSERPNRQYPDWSRNWQEVAFATCDDSVDDGLSRIVDGVPVSRAKWRKDSLKAYGNGIVHQVATEIIKGIKVAM